MIGLILMKKHHLQYKQERLDMDADPANQMAPPVIRVEGGWGLVQDIHGPHQTTQTRLIECHHPHRQVERTGKNTTNYMPLQVFRMHTIFQDFITQKDVNNTSVI